MPGKPLCSLCFQSASQRRLGGEAVLLCPVCFPVRSSSDLPQAAEGSRCQSRACSSCPVHRLQTPTPSPSLPSRQDAARSWRSEAGNSTEQVRAEVEKSRCVK